MSLNLNLTRWPRAEFMVASGRSDAPWVTLAESDLALSMRFRRPQIECHFAKNQLKRPAGTIQPDCDRVENECNSSLSGLNSVGLEFPNGFEAWA